MQSGVIGLAHHRMAQHGMAKAWQGAGWQGQEKAHEATAAATADTKSDRWHIPSLTELNLGGNGLGPRGVKALARVLTPSPETGRYNTRLTSLDLSGNSLVIGRPDLRDEGLIALCEALMPREEQKEEEEEDRSGGDDAAAAGDAGGGGGGDNGAGTGSIRAAGGGGGAAAARPTMARAAAAGSCCNRTLKRLVLAKNGIDFLDPVADVIGWCGGEGNRLEELDLSDNPVGLEGVAAISFALRRVEIKGKNDLIVSKMSN